MDTIECIKTRRSVRSYINEKPGRELIEQVVSAAAWAPSWKNTQIARYIAIEDRKLLDEIAERFVPSYNARIIQSAPLLFAVTMMTGRSGFERDGTPTTDRGDGWQMFDCGVACQTLCLAAHAMGLGTVIMGIFERKGLEQFLEVPEGQELVALVAAGYPDTTPAAPPRKDVSVLLTYR